MNDQPALFSVDTLPARCPICAATNTGTQRTPDCGVDASWRNGDWIKRPPECLNKYDPSTEPWPDGF